MGQTAGKIHDIFDACKSIPCVLMLDEIDCVAVNRTNRGGKGADGELERTTISLMQEMDALPNHVTLIAATNRIEMMDDAVLRRFSIKHEVTEMQTWDTEAMLRQFVRATGTEQYIGNNDILKIVTVSNNPGIAMTELKKKIGAAMYNEVGCKPAAEMRASEDVELPIWTVTYTWQKDICAETKEEAIAAGMGERRSFAYTGAVKPLEQYDAHIKTE
jgi:SpoVK/Ycf46/Vps4 family AAA+-type ATPase